MASIPCIGFAAASGTGKTTLLTKLIPILRQQHHLRVGLIKHSHHDFEIDQPGKDSYALRQAGASPVALISRHRQAYIIETPDAAEPRLADMLRIFDPQTVDLVLVEGFRHEAIPKIELHRPILQRPPLFPEDPAVIAIATDASNLDVGPLPLLDLNRPQQIADFILSRFFHHA